jgi:predicted RND superfamily exporter protein
MDHHDESRLDSMGLRRKIEDGLGGWAQLLWRFRWPVTIGMLAAAGYLATYIPTMVVKMASEDFLFEEDPIRATYDAFKVEFGQDQIASLTIAPPEIFDLAFLEKLRAFHEDLEDEVPFLEDVTSLVNVRSTYGRDEELVVEDLLDEMPTTEEELVALRERVLSTPFYFKTGILSDDGRATAVRVEVAVYSSGDPSDSLPDGSSGDPSGGEGIDSVDTIMDGFEEGSGEAGSNTKRPFLSGVENGRLIEALHQVIARHAAPDFPIQAAGGTMMVYEFTKALGRDVPLFFGGGLAVIGLFLALLFRRLAPIFLCFAVVIPATFATFGLAAFLRIPFSAPAQIIPSFLLAIGVSYSVHLITIFLHDLSEGRSRLDSLEHALRYSGLPILMTGVTTSAGVMSFWVAEMKPIGELGSIAAIGVVVMLAYSMILLPALLAIIPMKGRPEGQTPRIDWVLGFLASSSARHPWAIVGGAALLGIGSLFSMTLLVTNSDPTSWFPKDHPYSVAAGVLNKEFGGQSAIEVIIDTGRENGLHEPEMLRRLESIDEIVAEARSAGADLTYTNSLVDIVKESHQALNANDPSFRVLPDDRRLIAQELLLFENGGSDDLEKVVDSQFSRARFTIRSGWTDGMPFVYLLKDLIPALEEAFAGVATIEVTGMSAVMARTVGAVMESMERSYVLALCLITPLMIILIGSLRAGLVSMVPNLLPILLILGLMGLTGIPIDMFTLLAGCIAIGLAVDDSIHFISGFRRYLAMGLDPVQAVEETMQSTGRALLFTSIVLTSGFAILMLSDMLNLERVGLLTAFAVASAFLLDVTVTPALLVLTHRSKAPEPALESS